MAILDKETEIENTFEDMDLDIENNEIDDDSSWQSLKENQYYIYIIIDKNIDGITQYFRDYGINISKVFTNIESARNTLIMQTEPTKLVVIDTGSGRFASMAARKSLIDLIGIGEDNSDITVFYTDSIIKNEVSYSKDINNKTITWTKFKSVPQVLATLLQNKGKDEYIIDSEYIEIRELEFSKESKGIKDSNYKTIDIGSVQIDVSEISRFVTYTDEESRDKRYRAIEQYKVEI